MARWQCCVPGTGAEGRGRGDRPSVLRLVGFVFVMARRSAVAQVAATRSWWLSTLQRVAVTWMYIRTVLGWRDGPTRSRGIRLQYVRLCHVFVTRGGGTGPLRGLWSGCKAVMAGSGVWEIGMEMEESGIRMLLAAEQEAQQIVASARAAKVARLRRATEEAEEEVAVYRAQRAAEFKKQMEKVSSSTGWNVKRLEDEAAVKIEALEAAAAEVRPEVVELLLKYVTTVKN